MSMPLLLWFIALSRIAPAPGNPPVEPAPAEDGVAPGSAGAPGLVPEAHDIHLGIATGLFLTPSERTLMAAGEPVAAGPAGLQFNLRLDYMPWTYLGIEAEVGHVAQQSPPDETLGLFKLGGHALVQWPGRFAPFLLMGGGVLGATSDARQLDQALRPEAHWGLGTKWYLQHEILIRAEVRHLVDLVDAGPVQQFEMLVGLSFRLN